MLLTLGIMIVRTGGFRLQREDIEVLAPFLIAGLIVVALCSTIYGKFIGWWSVLMGILLGVVSVVVFGILWASQAQGFELRPGLVTASLMLSIPSGIGGGIIGWLYRRREHGDED